MVETSWPAEWLRGVLSLCVLALVAADGDTYGYQITQRLEACGFGQIKGGTLYPILARLEADGLIASEWREGAGGPGRKYVAITAQGRTALRAHAAQWQEFGARTAHVLALVPKL